ncbi:MAG TPA: hypothetical protein VNH46_10600, partial [Gemmatimonadales bacterium]|nr:hypothetical protein [Gemmatimonadales bacterium]
HSSDMVERVFWLLVPDPAGAIWLGAMLALVLFGRPERPFDRRNLALVALLLLSPLLAHSYAHGGFVQKHLEALFTLIFLLTAGYAAWGLVLSRRTRAAPWRPNLSRVQLRGLLLFVLAYNVITVLGRFPDDAGYYTNLGAQRWMETGKIPYADYKLRGPDAPAFGAAATYGPLLYVAHMPFQLVLGLRHNPADAEPEGQDYRIPAVPATQLTCLTFWLIGLMALYRVLRRMAGEETALAGVILYAGSPYIAGMGSAKTVIGGLAYISHIAPSAVTLAAFALMGEPLLSGLLLAVGVGVLFYPAFMFPAWFGWYLFRRRGAGRFALGFGVGCLAIIGLVLVFSRGLQGETAAQAFERSTVEHQEGTTAREYGASHFSFWGTHPALAEVWQRPLTRGSSIFKPTFLLFVGFCGLTFFLARGRSQAQLAGLTAAVAAAVQLWKTHATGTYVAWYLPFLLLALLAAGVGVGDVGPAPGPG